MSKITGAGSGMALRSLDEIAAPEPEPAMEAPPPSTYNGEWANGYELDVNFG